MDKNLDTRKLSDQIIHKIQNSINFMSIKTQMVLINEKSSPDSLEYAHRFKEELSHITKLVESLHKIAPVDKESIQTVNMKKLLDSTLALAENEMTLENVKIVKKYENELPEIRMAPQSFYELLFLIIENSIFAMNGNGTMTFDVRKMNTDGKVFIQTAISDTGNGIPEKDLSKVLGPFFTTQKESNCAGLGLTLCQAIVESYHGAIKVDSEPGKGTTVTIEFPAVK